MTLRGDWKFLKQCLNLNRNAQTENICFCCMASKGNRDQEMNFTDLSDDAGWKQTVFSSPPPWRRPPAFHGLNFFGPDKIGLDLLHIWHLGVCRDLKLAQLFSFFLWLFFCSAVRLIPDKKNQSKEIDMFNSFLCWGMQILPVQGLEGQCMSLSERVTSAMVAWKQDYVLLPKNWEHGASRPSAPLRWKNLLKTIWFWKRIISQSLIFAVKVIFCRFFCASRWLILSPCFKFVFLRWP